MEPVWLEGRQNESCVSNSDCDLATDAAAIGGRARRRQSGFFRAPLVVAGFLAFVLISVLPGQATTTSPFDQSAIDDAMSQPMKAFGPDSTGPHGDTPSVVHSAQAFFFLALVAHYDPSSTSTGGASVANQVLAIFRFYVAGGHEPACSNPLYGWGDGPVGQGLLLIKKTPALWNALTPTEQGKADLLMSALAIAGNWGFNDQNNFTTGLGGGGNFRKTNNPNFVQSYIGIELACSIYFGGAAGCNNVFSSFDFNTFTAQLTAAGFSNITASWNITGATAMNGAVKAAFVYGGVPLSDPNGIYYQEAVVMSNAMYNNTVADNACSGAAHIVSGTSPELGLLGEAHEFNSTDSSGCRSDALYTYEGWMGSIEGRTALQVFGLWGEPCADQSHVSTVETQMNVGSTDLIYKLHQGYVGISLAGSRTITDGATDLPVGKGYLYIHNIWDKLINTGNTRADFTISATPATQTVTAGNSTTYTVTIGALNNFNGSVALSASGLPTGASAGFNPATINGAGTSTLTITTTGATPAGSSTITITGTDCASHSTTATLVVNSSGGGTTTTVSSNHNPSVFGQSVTFTATVSPGGATGTVQFKDGVTNLGSAVTLTSGTATFTTSSLAVGSHSITAVYSGDSNFTTSTGSLPMQTVNQAASSTSVSSSVNPSVFGQAVTFTATVSASPPGAGTPTGTVQFKDGVTNLGSAAALTSGTATFMTSSLAVGAHSITAVYSGDSNFTTSTGSLPTQTVNKANTGTVVSSSLNPSNSGQAVTFTAAVTASGPGSGTPTGTATFFDGASNIGSGALDGAGHATFTTSILSIGGHSITAQYGGDSGFNGSTSPILTQTVNSVAGFDIAVSSLTHQPTISSFGGRLVFTATIANNGSAPANSVVFTESFTGKLMIAAAVSSVGSCTITAQVSCPLGTVNNGSPVTITVTLVPLPLGRSVQATATVTPTDGNPGNNSATDNAVVRFRPFVN